MSEPTMEEKAILGMARQAFEIALKNCTFRWLFCWDGEKDQSCFDCACCIAWQDDEYHTCGCICHERMRELGALFYAALRSKELHNKSWWWNRGLNGIIREVNNET